MSHQRRGLGATTRKLCEREAVMTRTKWDWLLYVPILNAVIVLFLFLKLCNQAAKQVNW